MLPRIIPHIRSEASSGFPSIAIFAQRRHPGHQTECPVDLKFDFSAGPSILDGRESLLQPFARTRPGYEPGANVTTGAALL